MTWPHLPPKGHCMHAPRCIGVGEPDERDPLGCCNCGTRGAEKVAPAQRKVVEHVRASRPDHRPEGAKE